MFAEMVWLMEKNNSCQQWGRNVSESRDNGRDTCQHLECKIRALNKPFEDGLAMKFFLLQEYLQQRE